MLLALSALPLLFVGPPAPPSAFADRTAEFGLALDTNAACWVDLDNDGWVDLVASGRAWRSEQGKRFTAFADVGSCVAADYDGDGFADLFSYSRMKLYRSVAGRSFEEAPLPDLPATSSLGACWADLNGDGALDLYVGGFEDWERQVTFPSFVLLNERGKGFRLAWTGANWRTRGVTACDLDRDGRAEVYVSNYRLQPNQLYRFDAAGRPRDTAVERNALGTSPGFAGGHSIGACWGDFNSDGIIDLFCGNFAHVDSRGDQPKSRFLRGTGAAGGWRFDDRGPCGVHYQESYATPAAGDFDNDGDLDLFFTTVYGTASFGRPNFPALFRNDGGLAFSDATADAGLAGLPPTYQAAWADVDNDGRLDLLAGGKLFMNQGAPRTWLKVRLRGDGLEVNRLAVGAQVRIRLKDRTLTRQVEAGTGQGNQNDLALHFGLGAHRGPVDLGVFWPNGRMQTMRGVRTGRSVEVTYRPVRRQGGSR